MFKHQVSESMEAIILLALSGGLMDAYSYLERGGVFANAQTGNILLLGVNIAEGHFDLALKYFCPIIAFALGIAIGEVIRIKRPGSFHWRQYVIVIEIIFMLIVGVIPLSFNLLANSLLSFACGLQVESFRKLHGLPIATTMCIGNLRSGVHALVDHLALKKKDDFHKCLLYFGVILFFIIGAIIGNYLIDILGIKAIWASIVILAAAFLLMFINHDKMQS